MTDKKHGGQNMGSDPRRDVSGTRGGPPKQQQDWPGTTDAMGPAPDHGEETYKGTGKLRGKVALVTGGDSGIGRAIAIAFAREGANVAITYLDEESDAQQTLEWIRRADRRGLAIKADLTDPVACKDVVEHTVQELAHLDILVNNAAYQMEQSDFLKVTPDQILRTFRTNIIAYMLVAQAALRHLPAGGVILNTGSVTAFEGNDGLIDYAATKAGIHNFTSSLAKAVAERGIRVNCVAPGPVWTPLIPATLEAEHVGKFGSTTAWERPAQPAEIAPSYVFLASDDGRYYTGETLAPTGRTTSR
jgi:NAD(P)-dependent dehydrogenase (short-subunit alcohol dehydrogenase family)